MAEKKKKYYGDIPVAPAKKRADKPIIQNPSLGNDMPSVPFVPSPPAFGKPPIGGSHGYGHKPHQRVGHLRISDVPKAHRIGKK